MVEKHSRWCIVKKEASMHIVLIGAGSAQFGLGSLGDIMQSKLLVGSTITLVDIDEKALARVNTIAQSFIKEKNLNFTVTATTDRKAALKDADAVIISIEVGKRFPL